MKENSKQKLQKIEELMQDDLQNGRHKQKKLVKALESNGENKKSFCDKLRQLKLVLGQ